MDEISGSGATHDGPFLVPLLLCDAGVPTPLWTSHVLSSELVLGISSSQPSCINAQVSTRLYLLRAPVFSDTANPSCIVLVVLIRQRYLPAGIGIYVPEILLVDGMPYLPTGFDGMHRAQRPLLRLRS